MSSSLAPDPCLVAILLVVRTRAGPKVVYHYPPNPSLSPASSNRSSAWVGVSGNFTDAADSSESDGSSDSDYVQPDGDSSSRAGSRSSTGRGSGRRDLGGSLRSARTRDTGTAYSNDDLDEEMPDREKHDKHVKRRSDHGKSGDNDDEQSIDTVLGFGVEGLAKLLAPGRVFHKRRFEFGINHLVFVGAPRFVREDGLWKKKRRTKRTGQQDESQATRQKDPIQKGNSLSQLTKQFEEVPAYGAAYGHSTSEAPSEIHSESHSVSSNGRRSESDLTMFNVVFVMNPPALEYSIRVQEMYDHVIKKFAKALKYAQAFNNYVYQESRAILAMKEKGKDKHTPRNALWSTIAQNSSLARAIMVTFNTISDDKIAHINLGRDFDASFQLPQPISTPSISTPIQPQMPGLWLTTATPWEHDEPDTLLSPHSALLLLEDDDVLLKEVESDAKELSGPLSHFVRILTPEKSLLKIAQKSSLSINDVQLLARHLIYWRRGRAIPPLRQRDVYIVSPNADMRNLETAIAEFATRFPTLPSLASILNLLSGTPRAWYTLFPSRDHRATYMRILAWLMRHGWVTQLRTFGWIRVTADIKKAVAANEEVENGESRSAEQSIEIRSSPFIKASDADNTGSTGTNRRKQTGDVITSTPTRSRRPDSVASDSTSVSSGQTAVTVLPPAVPPFSPLSKPVHTSHTTRSSISTTNSSQPDSLQSPASSAAHTDDLTSPALTAIPSSHLDSPLHQPISTSTAPLDDIINNNNDTSSFATHQSETYTASIIHSPQDATALELRWIEQIGHTFTPPSISDSDTHTYMSTHTQQHNHQSRHNSNTSTVGGGGITTTRAFKDRERTASMATTATATSTSTTTAAAAPIKSLEQEAQTLWPVLLKYFDGKHAFEEIYLREGLKKKRVASVLQWLSGAGWLVTVRHW